MNEIERIMRMSYLHDKEQKLNEIKAKDAIAALKAERKGSEKVKYELQIVSMQAEKDKKAIESERARLRSLIGNVAHDLKTPLQSIGMSIELLRYDLRKHLTNDAVPQTIREANMLQWDSLTLTLDSLTSMSSFMAMAINRCLDFTKASSGIALVSSMETIDLVEALAIPVTCINNLQSDQTIIVNSLPCELCQFIITDKHWLIENVLCLLSNATKYSTGGDINLIVDLTFHTNKFLSHKVLRLTIEDSGIGIPNEARKRLFKPFTQAQRMTGGTGLGLYSLSKRMEALGGAYGVHDRLDGKQGSAFWFSFPYRPDNMCISKDDSSSPNFSRSSFTAEETRRMSVDKVYNERVKERSDECTAEQSSSIIPRKINKHDRNDMPKVLLKILIVEDSLSILKVVSHMLRQKGHTVQSALNGSLGLDLMTQGYHGIAFDVVLMDLQMPVMDGIEATRRFREYEKQQNELHADGKTTEVFKNGNSSPIYRQLTDAYSDRQTIRNLLSDDDFSSERHSSNRALSGSGRDPSPIRGDLALNRPSKTPPLERPLSPHRNTDEIRGSAESLRAAAGPPNNISERPQKVKKYKNSIHSSLEESSKIIQKKDGNSMFSKIKSLKDPFGKRNIKVENHDTTSNRSPTRDSGKIFLNVPELPPRKTSSPDLPSLGGTAGKVSPPESGQKDPVNRNRRGTDPSACLPAQDKVPIHRFSSLKESPAESNKTKNGNAIEALDHMDQSARSEATTVGGLGTPGGFTQTIDDILRTSIPKAGLSEPGFFHEALPIIGMSANSDSISKDCALQAGMNLFLAKPFTIGELQTVLEKFRPREFKIENCSKRNSIDALMLENRHITGMEGMMSITE
eukprot:CAMPEP_0119039596 /NCGR_PEP_ID=MMETSP1177-20130426/9171_1 /TAXON_ID=2985 /ORGANISM="Ochromonas sp, Strain CCMP1899" /LENGTH=853 /DNA_ID=CAMNT_0007003679 /DNA_START=1000 /DNA_END=3561 /DNA_ORIENTATION=+